MKRNIKVGQFVQVIAKVERVGHDKMSWNSHGKMDHLLNDGNWYKVNYIHWPNIGLDCNGASWCFLSDCLTDSVEKGELPKTKAKKKIKKPRLKSLRAAVERETRKEKGHAISCYGIRTDLDDQMQINDVCYYRLRIFGDAVPKEVAVSLNNYIRLVPKKSQPIYKEYAKYILESPAWNLPFLTRNVTTAFRYGMYMDVTQPLSRIVGSLTALREGVEFPQKLVVFDKILKLGYSGDVAFLISSIFWTDGENYQIILNSSGHKILTNTHSLKGVIKFLKEGYRDLGEAPYTEEKADYQCQEAVCPKKGQIVTDVNKICSTTKIGEGWDKKSVVTEENLIEFANKLTKMFQEKK